MNIAENFQARIIVLLILYFSTDCRLEFCRCRLVGANALVCRRVRLFHCFCAFQIELHF